MDINTNSYVRPDMYYNLYDICALLDENDFIKLFSVETCYKDKYVAVLENIFKDDNIKIEVVSSHVPTNIIEESKELFEELIQFDDNIYETVSKYIDLQKKMVEVNGQLKLLQNNLFCNKTNQSPLKPTDLSHNQIMNEHRNLMIEVFPPIKLSSTKDTHFPLHPLNHITNPSNINDILIGYEENSKFSSFNKVDEIDKSSTIFYNSFSKTFYLFSNSSEEFETINNIKNCGFEKLLDIDLNLVDKKIMETLLFSRKYDQNEISKVIELFTSTIKNNSDLELEKQIQNYIEFNYVITKELNDKIPAKKIKDDLANTLKLPASQFVSFRNKLGPILISLGLQKKRYKEGIFYYGLKKKDSIESIDPLTGEQMSTEYQKLLEERNKFISSAFPPKENNKKQIEEDLMRAANNVTCLAKETMETLKQFIS